VTINSNNSALPLVDGVEAVFQELDASIARFQSETGWNCREGCGDCCNSPEVEVSVLEALPHALLLWQSSKADFYHTLLTEKLGSPCAFYVSRPEDRSMGRCSIYGTRPMLCRMFGFTAQTDKAGGPRLAACHWQKMRAPELLLEIDNALKQGTLEAPLFGYWEQRLSELDPSQLLGERLPINEAFLKAIDYVYWRRSSLGI